jgi:hypothetical protein
MWNGDGYVPRPIAQVKNLTDLDDVNPDRWPSHSGTYCEDRGHDVIWVLRVKGLGAIVMRAVQDNKTFHLKDDGVSIFTDGEIGEGRVSG